MRTKQIQKYEYIEIRIRNISKPCLNILRKQLDIHDNEQSYILIQSNVRILYTNFERGHNCGMEVEIVNDKAKIPNESLCVVCEKIKLDGIHLYKSFLCNECERNIIRTSIKDPEYKFYLERLKKIRIELLS